MVNEPGVARSRGARVLSLCALSATTLTAGMCAGVAAAAAVAPQDRTASDRVYTAAQAERGQRAYAESCRACHGDDLGGDKGPALAGDAFMMEWESDTLKTLFTRIKETMPQQAPSTLGDETYLEIVAYILQANSFSPGTDELPLAPDALAAITIVKQSPTGSVQVPDLALIQVVGCLARAPDNQWILTSATEPVRTRAPKPTAATLNEATGTPSGTRRFQLIGVEVFQPHLLSGQKVEARGLLIRSPGGDRLNLTSLQAVASRCASER